MSDILWSPGVKLEHIEKKVILKAMAYFKNDRESTAKSLGISRRTLDGRISEYKKTEGKDVTDPKDYNPRERRTEGLGSIKAVSTASEYVPSEEPFTLPTIPKSVQEPTGETDGNQAPPAN